MQAAARFREAIAILEHARDRAASSGCDLDLAGAATAQQGCEPSSTVWIVAVRRLRRLQRGARPSRDVQAKGCHLRAGATSRRKAGRRAVCHGGAFAGLIASPLNPLLRPGQCGRRCATPSHDVCRQVFPPPALPKPTGLASLWRNLVTCDSDAKLEKDYAVLIAQSIASAVAKARAEAATSLEQAPLVSLGMSLGSARRCLALSRVGARKL